MKNNEKRLELIMFFGGMCNKCSYDENLSALHFHHINPSEKSFSISGTNLSRPFNELLREAQKCVLVCANCHADIHNKTKKKLNVLRCLI